MKCLKGIVTEMKSGLMLVKLNSGLKFWAKATPTSRLKRAVLVAWDYVRDEPREVWTEDDWNIVSGSTEKTEDGVFSFPKFREVVEGEVTDFPADTSVLPNQFWWHSEGVEVGDGGDGVFSYPSNDEPEDGGSDGHHNDIHI